MQGSTGVRERWREGANERDGERVNEREGERDRDKWRDTERLGESSVHFNHDCPAAGLALPAPSRDQPPHSRHSTEQRLCFSRRPWRSMKCRVHCRAKGRRDGTVDVAHRGGAPLHALAHCQALATRMRGRASHGARPSRYSGLERPSVGDAWATAARADGCCDCLGALRPAVYLSRPPSPTRRSHLVGGVALAVCVPQGSGAGGATPRCPLGLPMHAQAPGFTLGWKASVRLRHCPR